MSTRFQGYPLDQNPYVIRVGKFDWWKIPCSPSWYRFLRFKDGKPNPVAVCLLMEVVNRYQPIKETDEDGEMMEWRKRFPGIWMKLDYERLCRKYNFSKRQFEDAAAMLREKGLIETHVVLEEQKENVWASVSYIEPRLAEIEQISLRINPEEDEFENCKFPPGRVHKYDKHGKEVCNSFINTTPPSSQVPTSSTGEAAPHLTQIGGSHLTCIGDNNRNEIKENNEMKLNNNNSRACAHEDSGVVVAPVVGSLALDVSRELECVPDKLPEILGDEPSPVRAPVFQIVRTVLPEEAQSLVDWTLSHHPDALRLFDHQRETIIALAKAYEFDDLTACYQSLPKQYNRNWRSVQRVIEGFCRDRSYVQNFPETLVQEGRDEVVSLGVEWSLWVCDQAKWLRAYERSRDLFGVQEFREELQKKVSGPTLREAARLLDQFVTSWQSRIYAPEVERLIAYGVTEMKARELFALNVDACREKLDYVDADRASGRNKIQSPAGWLIPAIRENWVLQVVPPTVKKNGDLYIGGHREGVNKTYTPEQEIAYMAYLQAYEAYVRREHPEVWVAFEKAVMEWTEAGLICAELTPEDQFASNLITFFTLNAGLIKTAVLSMDEWIKGNS